MTLATNPLQARGLKPAAVLAAGRDHGDRLRYAAGCRCSLCRAANNTYERIRQAARLAGDWNGIVSADKARSWMAHLSAQGVGRRAIADASDVAHTVLMDIRSGRKTQIRALTERRILAVTVEMALDGALVSAGPTWALIDELLAAGFTKRLIALRLGYKNGALQLRREFVTVRNAALLKKLYGELINSGEGLIDAKPTWRYIAHLRTEGYTDKQLARQLGFADGELSIGKQRISQRLAQLVKQMHERLTT